MLYYFGSVLIVRKGVFLLHFKSVHARIEELLKGISGVAFEMNEMPAFLEFYMREPRFWADLKSSMTGWRPWRACGGSICRLCWL